MNPNESSVKLVESRKAKQRITCDYNKGITKTLLDKYKPSEILNTLDSGKKDFKSLRTV